MQTTLLIQYLVQGTQSGGTINAINLLTDIRSVNSLCKVVLLNCTEQNINNQTYVHISFCLMVIRPWLNMPTSGHGHVIWMGVVDMIFPKCHVSVYKYTYSSSFVQSIQYVILIHWHLLSGFANRPRFLPHRRQLLKSITSLYGWNISTNRSDLDQIRQQ